MMVIKFRSRQREADRPRIRPEFTYADWLVEAFVLCLLLALIGYSVYWYARLPQIIPTHFDIRVIFIPMIIYLVVASKRK